MRGFISAKESICSQSDREQILSYKSSPQWEGVQNVTVSYFPYKCIYSPIPRSTQISSVDYSKARKKLQWDNVVLKRLDTFGRFSIIFYNFSDFLFAFLHTKDFLKNVLP